MSLTLKQYRNTNRKVNSLKHELEEYYSCFNLPAAILLPRTMDVYLCNYESWQLARKIAPLDTTNLNILHGILTVSNMQVMVIYDDKTGTYTWYDFDPAAVYNARELTKKLVADFERKAVLITQPPQELQEIVYDAGYIGLTCSINDEHDCIYSYEHGHYSYGHGYGSYKLVTAITGERHVTSRKHQLICDACGLHVF